MLHSWCSGRVKAPPARLYLSLVKRTVRRDAGDAPISIEARGQSAALKLNIRPQRYLPRTLAGEWPGAAEIGPPGIEIAS